MRIRFAAAVIVVFLSALPTISRGAPGTCTMQASGAINGGDAVWGVPAAGCRDLGNGCNGTDAGCPDSDDDVQVNGKALTIDRGATVDRFLNAGINGQVVIKEGITFKAANVDGSSSDPLACATCTLVVEPGAILQLVGPDNGVGATIDGTAVIQGRKIADVTLAASTGGCSGGGSDQKVVAFTAPVADAKVGDILQITGGLARAYTFEIASVSSTNAKQVTLNLAMRDPFPKCSSGNATVQADKRKFQIDAGGPDFVTANDQAYLGKFLIMSGSYRGPIVAFSSGTGERDTATLFAPQTALSGSVAFEMAYGFELGGDTGVIYRPAKIANGSPATCAGGGTRQCSFGVWNQNGSNTRWEYADITAVGVAFIGINGSPSTEGVVVKHFSVHDQPVNFPTPLALGGIGVESERIALEWIDIFNYRASPGIELTGSGNILRNSVVRDMTAAQGAASGSAVRMGLPSTVGEITVEDVNLLRVPDGIVLGTTSATTQARVRRVWCVGRQSNAQPGSCVTFNGGVGIDPANTARGKNDGAARVFSSVFMGTRNAIVGAPGTRIGQAMPLVNSVAAYSGFTVADNSDGEYRGDAWHSVLAYNARHGQSECTWCVGSIARDNANQGLSSLAEYCTNSTCAPTPFDRHLLGNIAYGNGTSALGYQEVNRATEALHNTLANDSASTSHGADFNPVSTPYPTASNPTIACGNGECSQAGGQRPTWWIAAPNAQPDVTFRDNLIGKQGTSITGSRGASFSGTRFGAADLLSSFSHFWNWEDPDMGGFTPAATDVVNGAAPFVNADADDYRLAITALGSDGKPKGASIAGIVAGDAAMPTVYKVLKDQGEKFTVIGGDFLFSVDPDGDKKANFLDMDMTGKRVRFAFPTAPTLPGNSCGNPTDLGEKCGMLKLKLFRSDGTAVSNEALVPVDGAGKIWSVAESAMVLLWSGIEDAGDLRVALQIGSTESPSDVWPMSRPYKIPRYVVPVGGALAESGTPPIGGPR